MLTMVQNRGPSPYYKNTIVFDVWNISGISEVYIEGFKSGIVEICAEEGADIKDFIEFVVGIFEPKSNFVSTIYELYDSPIRNFKGVTFDFNGIKFLVTKENANAKELYKYWDKEVNKMIRADSTLHNLYLKVSKFFSNKNKS